MITTFYPPCNFGGDGIFVQSLSRELVRLGHEVTVVHCADAYALKSGAPPPTRTQSVDSAEDAKIEVISLQSKLGRLSPVMTQQSGRPWLKRSKLAQTLARAFDVVNFHNISLIGGPAILSLPAGGAKKVYTLHEHWLLCATHVFWKNQSIACDKRQCLRCSLRSGVPPQLWRYGSLIRNSLAHVDLLISPSEFTARLHRDAFPDGPEVLVNPHFSRLETPAHTDRSDDDYFLYVGRVTASKGILELAQAFAGHHGLRLKVAGGGDLEASLRDRYRSAPNIQFLGPVPASQLIGLYARATAAIVPSIAPETFGLSVLEALGIGTPAVVREAGGCAEIIRATGAGFVFGSFDELPPLLHNLRANAGMRELLRQRASEGVERLYTRRRHLSAYLSAIQALTEAPRAS